MNLVNALHFPGFLVLNTSIVFKPGSISAVCRLNRDRKKEGDVTNLVLPKFLCVLPKLLLLLLKLLPLLLIDSVGKRVLGNLRPPVFTIEF